MEPYKPDNYSSLSSYLKVDDAQEFVDLQQADFETKIFRRLDLASGKITNIEIQWYVV